MLTLNLNDLCHKRVPAISDNIAYAMREACELSLQCNNHQPGVVMNVQGEFDEIVPVNWNINNNEKHNIMWDPDDASEWGATCVALLLISEFTGFVACDRAFKGKGFDYWLSTEPKKSSDELFGPKNHTARLEVSGIRKGTPRDINARVKKKLNQVSPSDYLGLPAYVFVVEFGRPISKTAVKKP